MSDSSAVSPRNRCTHPMFGPESGANGWAGLPFLYDRVRTKDHARTADFLSIWEGERCKMVEMSCELHDKYAANTQFITHLMGRILGKQVTRLGWFSPPLCMNVAHTPQRCLGSFHKRCRRRRPMPSTASHPPRKGSLPSLPLVSCLSTTTQTQTSLVCSRVDRHFASNIRRPSFVLSPLNHGVVWIFWPPPCIPLGVGVHVLTPETVICRCWRSGTSKNRLLLSVLRTVLRLCHPNSQPTYPDVCHVDASILLLWRCGGGQSSPPKQPLF